MTDCCLCVWARPTPHARLIAALYPRADPSAARLGGSAAAAAAAIAAVAAGADVGKLAHFAAERPRFLAQIGRELEARARRDLRKGRLGFVAIAVRAVSTILATAGEGGGGGGGGRGGEGGATTLALFEEHVAALLLTLLVHPSPVLKHLAAELAVQFVAEQDYLADQTRLDELLLPLLHVARLGETAVVVAAAAAPAHSPSSPSGAAAAAVAVVAADPSHSVDRARAAALEAIAQLLSKSDAQTLEGRAGLAIPIVLATARREVALAAAAAAAGRGPSPSPPTLARRPYASAVLAGADRCLSALAAALNPATATGILAPILATLDGSFWQPRDFALHVLRIIDPCSGGRTAGGRGRAGGEEADERGRGGRDEDADDGDYADGEGGGAGGSGAAIMTAAGQRRRGAHRYSRAGGDLSSQASRPLQGGGHHGGAAGVGGVGGRPQQQATGVPTRAAAVGAFSTPGCLLLLRHLTAVDAAFEAQVLVPTAAAAAEAAAAAAAAAAATQSLNHTHHHLIQRPVAPSTAASPSSSSSSAAAADVGCALLAVPEPGLTANDTLPPSLWWIRSGGGGSSRRAGAAAAGSAPGDDAWAARAREAEKAFDRLRTGLLGAALASLEETDESIPLGPWVAEIVDHVIPLLLDPDATDAADGAMGDGLHHPAASGLHALAQRLLLAVLFRLESPSDVVRLASHVAEAFADHATEYAALHPVWGVLGGAGEAAGPGSELVRRYSSEVLLKRVPSSSGSGLGSAAGGALTLASRHSAEGSPFSRIEAGGSTATAGAGLVRAAVRRQSVLAALGPLAEQQHQQPSPPSQPPAVSPPLVAAGASIELPVRSVHAATQATHASLRSLAGGSASSRASVRLPLAPSFEGLSPAVGAGVAGGSSVPSSPAGSALTGETEGAIRAAVAQVNAARVRLLVPIRACAAHLRNLLVEARLSGGVSHAPALPADLVAALEIALCEGDARARSLALCSLHDVLSCDLVACEAVDGPPKWREWAEEAALKAVVAASGSSAADVIGTLFDGAGSGAGEADSTTGARVPRRGWIAGGGSALVHPAVRTTERQISRLVGAAYHGTCAAVNSGSVSELALALRLARDALRLAGISGVWRVVPLAWALADHALPLGLTAARAVLACVGSAVDSDELSAQALRATLAGEVPRPGAAASVDEDGWVSASPAVNDAPPHSVAAADADPSAAPAWTRMGFAMTALAVPQLRRCLRETCGLPAPLDMSLPGLVAALSAVPSPASSSSSTSSTPSPLWAAAASALRPPAVTEASWPVRSGTFLRQAVLAVDAAWRQEEEAAAAVAAAIAATATAEAEAPGAGVTGTAESPLASVPDLFPAAPADLARALARSERRHTHGSGAGGGGGGRDFAATTRAPTGATSRAAASRSSRRGDASEGGDSTGASDGGSTALAAAAAAAAAVSSRLLQCLAVLLVANVQPLGRCEGLVETVDAAGERRVNLRGEVALLDASGSRRGVGRGGAAVLSPRAGTALPVAGGASGDGTDGGAPDGASVAGLDGRAERATLDGEGKGGDGGELAPGIPSLFTWGAAPGASSSSSSSSGPTSERPPRAPPSVEALAALVLAGGSSGGAAGRTGRRTTATTPARGPSALDAEHGRKRRGPGGRAPAGPPKLPDVRSRDDAWIRLAAVGPTAVRA
jgi:hypothetical protein